MRLCECNLGQIVVAKDDDRRIGHIVGLVFNNSMPGYWKDKTVEIIPTVQFVGEQLPISIHYANIDIFKKY